MKTGLAIAIGIATASTAAAQPAGGRFLPQMLSSEWSSNEPATAAAAFDAWPGLILRGDGVIVTARDAEMGFGTPDEGGAALYLRAPQMVIRGEVAGSPTLILEAVELRMDPRHTGGCGFLDAVRGIKADRTEIRFPGGTGFAADLVEVNGLDISMTPTAACTSEIAISAASALAGQAGAGSISVSGLAIAGHIPMTGAAAEAMTSIATMEVNASKISTWHEDGSLAHSTSELDVSLEVDPRSSAPIFLVLAQRDFFAPNWNTTTAFMDAWNIATFLRADAHVDTLTTQMIPTAIVPPASTLPFASAGLSTTSSTFEAGVRLRRGQWDLDLESYTAGIGSAKVSATLMPKNYDRPALRAADQAAPGTPPAPPPAQLGAFNLTWVDTGLDTAVAKLFGLPAALLVKESLETTTGDDPNRKSALAQTIWFFNKAAEGQPMTVHLSDESGVDLLNIVEVLTADPLWLASRLEFSSGINDEAQPNPQ